MSAIQEEPIDLTVLIGSMNTANPDGREYFRAQDWDAAIDRARDIAAGRTPYRDNLSRVQVIDAWGTLIAQFCPYWVYRHL